MPRPSLRSTFIAVAVALVGLHLVSVTLEALPPNRYSEAVQDRTAYVDPYFTQNWRLFAPNPISEDRSLSINRDSSIARFLRINSAAQR